MKEPESITCPYCKGSGKDDSLCPICCSEYLFHTSDGIAYCADCGIVEGVPLLDCPECGGMGSLSGESLIDYEHNIECNLADDYNDSRHE